MNNRRIGLTDEEVMRYKANGLIRGIKYAVALTIIGGCLLTGIIWFVINTSAFTLLLTCSVMFAVTCWFWFKSIDKTLSVYEAYQKIKDELKCKKQI